MSSFRLSQDSKGTEMGNSENLDQSHAAIISEYEAHISCLLEQEPKWLIAPFGITLVNNGSRLYLDYHNRPIFRVKKNGQTDVLSPNELICFSLIRDLHADHDGNYDPNARRLIINLITEHGLEEELLSRWSLFQRNELPDPSWGGRT